MKIIEQQIVHPDEWGLDSASQKQSVSIRIDLDALSLTDKEKNRLESGMYNIDDICRERHSVAILYFGMGDYEYLNKDYLKLKGEVEAILGDKMVPGMLADTLKRSAVKGRKSS